MAYENPNANLETSQPRRMQKRQTAIKTKIATLMAGEYIEQDDWNPNFVKTKIGDINRANIIGVVISKNEQNSSIIVDDNSGIITAMCNFSNNIKLESFGNGDIINIIGRPRIFNGEIYIVAEIAKKIEDLGWLKVRELELKQIPEINNISNSFKDQTIETETQQIKQEENFEDSITEEIVEKQEISDSYEIIYEYIKKNDLGNGVDFEDIVTKLKELNFESAEGLVKRLLEHGEIFELMPGKIKLLE